MNLSLIYIRIEGNEYFWGDKPRMSSINYLAFKIRYLVSGIFFSTFINYLPISKKILLLPPQIVLY